MKVFRVESNKVAYDEDESMVIIAESKKRALELALKNWKFRDGGNHNEFSVFEFDLTEEIIIDVAHYGD